MFSFFKSKSIPTPIELIKVSHDGLFINDHKIGVNFSKGDFKKIFGDPDRNELINDFQCFIYDKIGLDIFFNDDETFDRLGIDFEHRGMKHSPQLSFKGIIEICNLIVNSEENEKSFESSLTSNNIDFVNDGISLEIQLSAFIIEPYFNSTNGNICSIQIKT